MRIGRGVAERFDLGCCRMRLADVSDEKAQLGKAARAFQMCPHRPTVEMHGRTSRLSAAGGQAAMAKNALDSRRHATGRLAVVGELIKMLLHVEKDPGGHGFYKSPVGPVDGF